MKQDISLRRRKPIYRTFKEPQTVKYKVQLKTIKLSFFTSNKTKKRYLSLTSHTSYMYSRAPVVPINISERLIRPYLDGQKNMRGPKKIVRSLSTLFDAKTLSVCLKLMSVR